MFLVNFVDEDEELYEPYEWLDNDFIEEFPYLIIFRLTSSMLCDFLYGTLSIDDIEDGIYILSDGYYSFVVDIRNKMIDRRGSIEYRQLDLIHRIVNTLPVTVFHYRVLQRACVKEFGLTRLEREKKQIVEELLEDSYYQNDEIFNYICNELMINEKDKYSQYNKIISMIKKGYNHVHEIIYDEFISKNSR